ncbi:MAG: hypothetical protein ACWA5K_00060, partial [bacterium]
PSIIAIVPVRPRPRAPIKTVGYQAFLINKTMWKLGISEKVDSTVGLAQMFKTVVWTACLSPISTAL